MGIYYTAPLLGPSLGPIFGGVLTSGFNWRACYWFLMILGGITVLGFFLFFKDTFRRQRSNAYQTVLRRRLRERAESLRASDEARVAKSPISNEKEAEQDLEKQDPEDVPETIDNMKLSLTDVSPVKPLWLVLRRVNNLVILIASGTFLPRTNHILLLNNDLSINRSSFCLQLHHCVHNIAHIRHGIRI